MSPVRLSFALSLLLPAVMAPRESVPSGNWAATIRTAGGSADVTVSPRNDKQSLVKITVRDIAAGGSVLSWSIFVGRCLGPGRKLIAPPAAFTPVRTQMVGSGMATDWVPKLESGQRYSVGVRFAESSATGGIGGCASLREKP